MHFKLAPVLAVAHPSHKLLGDIKEIYDIIEYLTGVRPYTHQVPDAIKECQVYLAGCFPQLLGANLDGINPDNIETRMAFLIDQYGNHFVFDPMPIGGVLPDPNTGNSEYLLRTEHDYYKGA